MSTDDVEFVDVPSVHPPCEDLVVGLRYSPSFRPNLDDTILLLPVGWQSLNQSKSITPTHGQRLSSVKVSSVGLSGDQTGSFFQLVFVQEKVPTGMSNPFVVDIPYDEESLHDESLDVDITLIKPVAEMVVYDQSAPTNSSEPQDHLRSLHPDSQLNSRLQKEESTHQLQRQAVIVPYVETKDHEVRTGSLEDVTVISTRADTTESTNNYRERQGSKNDICSISTDEESFVVTEMPLSNSSSKRGDGMQTLAMQLANEKDELSRLFQRERKIALEQENSHLCLQQKYKILQQENSHLKETLQKRESEIEQLRRSVNEHPTLVTSSKQSSPLPVASVRVTHECNNTTFGKEQDRFSVDIKYPPSYIPPSPASLANYTEGSLPVFSCESSLVQFYDCPVCAGRFPKSEGATRFQCHVHQHFQDEQQAYY